MPRKMQSRIAAYCRSAVENSASIKGQCDRIREYIKTGTIGCYCDSGFSDSDLTRPGLTQLLHDVRKGKVAAVIVTDLQRIARSPSLLRSTLYTLTQHNVLLISLNNEPLWLT